MLFSSSYASAVAVFNLNRGRNQFISSFSKNGGIVWETIQQFAYGPDSNKVQYIALDIPHKMKGPSTRVRWWQLPDEDDIYSEEWAIEEVHKIMDWV